MKIRIFVTLIILFVLFFQTFNASCESEFPLNGRSYKPLSMEVFHNMYKKTNKRNLISDTKDSLIIYSEKYGEKIVLFDKEDYWMIKYFNWSVTKPQHLKDLFYAQAGIKIQKLKWDSISIHRLIMKEFNESVLIDHIDGNGLNNRKINLRSCTHTQNVINKHSKNGGTSKYLGVSAKLQKRKRKREDGSIYDILYFIGWRANIKINGKPTEIGLFDNEEDAAKCYDKYAKEIHGEFANLNFKNG